MTRSISRAFARWLLSVLAVPAAVSLLWLSFARATEADGFQVRPIEFAPCAEDADLDCGMLTVPVDYRRPHGETTQVAVIRARATDPAQRIGALVSNPGGPSFSGVDFILAGIHAPAVIRLNQAFDIYGFDPRGSNRSGAVACDVGAAGDPADVDPAQRAAFFDDFSAHVVEACFAQNGPFIGTLSTNNSARDMDTLRRAIGEEQITYVGVSFGTVLGAAYASMFPERVRAMILDAGVMPEFRDSIVEFNAEQMAGFEASFQHVDDLCSASATCPLRDAGVVATLDAVMARLNAAPVTSSSGAVLTGDLVRNVVADLLYVDTNWPTIVEELERASRGEYAFFFENAPGSAQLIRFAIETPTFTAYDAMLCNDYGTRRPAAEHVGIDEARGALFPRFFGPFFVSGEAARCAAWPQADEPVIRNVARRLSVPMLIYGNDYDPATPLSWTRSLAKVLGMERHLVRYTGGGHGVVTNGDPCIDALSLAYLLHLRLPAEGTTCPARIDAL
jgi:pimeloyl-ACP methyl ester carboxylesterase